jgi:hypothetical protein
MKQVTFTLSQSNGNRVSIEIKDITKGITQDAFAGTYLFPAMLRLVKGASKLFDKSLPVTLSFAAEQTDGEKSAKVLADIKIKSKSVHAVRGAVLVFNEAIAALVTPTRTLSVYDLIDMKGNKGGEFRTYAKAQLRPSVSLEGAINN